MRSARADPLFNSAEWALAYAESFLSDDDVFGWTILDSDGSAVAILPMRHAPARGRFALSRALLLVDGTFDSEYLEMPSRRGWEAAAWEVGLAALAASGRAQVAVLGCVPEDAACLADLRARNVPRRALAKVGFRLRLRGTFEEQLSAMPKSGRERARRSLRDASALAAKLRWCDDETRLLGDLATLYDLHARRWSSVGQAGSFGDPRRRSFYETLAREALSGGRLRFALLEVDGRPVAAQFGLLSGDRFVQLQEGFDPELSKQRVGHALRALVMQVLIDQGVGVYDFLVGGEAHKRPWGTEEVRCTTVGFPLGGLASRLAYRARVLIDGIRS